MKDKEQSPFIRYEYKEITVPVEHASMYLDCYEAFGWETDEKVVTTGNQHTVTVHLRRNRKIINKMELTRLQRHFESCVQEIDALKRSQTSTATMYSLAIGIIGTAFMAGSVFAVTHQPPIYWLCILLAVPAFLGWIAPYFVFRRISDSQSKKLQPLIDAKLDEIYEICEKGHALL